MRVDYTGRQTEVTPDLRQFTEGRLRKLIRLLGDRFALHVILTAEKHRRIAELTLNVRDHTLVGIEETTDPRSAIKAALDKLERQAVRLVERRRTRKRRPKPASTIRLNVLLGGRRVNNKERQGFATERIPIKPMTVEEAVDSLGKVSSGIVVFRNLETERVNVIYRRPDGKVGLIEPEP